MRGPKTKYEFKVEQLRAIVPTVYSYRQVLLACGYKGEGGNYRILKRILKENNIDTSHFKGKGWLKNATIPFSPKKTLKELLIDGSVMTSHKLKLRLLREKIIENTCVICGVTHWNGRELSLHLDHINGKSDDNRIENLRLLCPNCHSLTDTYCGKNKKK